ncbi:MAG: UDP-3-O-(3-hydroxymyristoyl)glucosamine N-acyltransferase [Steroidobacteraceae bacterium]|nr:UDP-3-O-(3-hydroxymyristoyl)glucosamine N-acyltransferase [Steroidobacteraceae bacterium]MDW8258507.1 UDP-3-O-(3-hydroxymyristoyl)glucosamine N-acyltransferase [Gammaproteobacteria bacterium]
MPGRHRLGDLAVEFGCELRGDPSVEVDSVAALADARPGQLSYIANPRLRQQLATTRASAVVLDRSLIEVCPVAALVHANPHATFARIAQRLHPPPVARPGVHPSAVVAPDAAIDPSAEIGPLCCVGPGAVIGPRALIGPGCHIAAGAQIGADVRLVARVTVCERVVIGPRCVIHPGAVLGGDGFGNARDQDGWVRVPQLGTVRLGADVDVGCNTTIDRGTFGDTVIEDGVRLDNQIQIGHNCRIGAHTAIAGCVGIAGSVTIGKRCMLAGDVGIAGHLTICDDVVITARTMITASIDEPGVYSGGWPGVPAAQWRRTVAELNRLGKLRARVKELERRLGTASES